MPGGVSYMPVAMERTYAGQQEAARDRAMQQRSMAEMQAAAQNEIWDSKEEKAKQNGMDLAAAQEMPRKDGQPANINEAIAQKKTQLQAQAAQQPKAEETMELIRVEMTKDIQRYMQLIVNYIRTTPTADLKVQIKDKEGLRSKFNMFLPFFPVQLRTFLKTMPFEEFEKLIELQAQEKYIEIKKKRMIPEVKELWAELQAQL
jgi:hypothetical protein